MEILWAKPWSQEGARNEANIQKQNTDPQEKAKVTHYIGGVSQVFVYHIYLQLLHNQECMK